MARRRVKERVPKIANLMLLLFGVLGLWVIGLFWFVDVIPEKITDRDSPADAIVVLTGGTGRLDAGLDLLNANKAPRLFVSGVYKGVEVRQLLTLSEKGLSHLESRIAIGNAENTLENAIETANWASGAGISSIRLVTAAYHMPRSILEFNNAMPDIRIIPNPVFPDHVKQDRWYLYPGTARLFIDEFNKYLLAGARNWVNYLFFASATGVKKQGTSYKAGKSSG